MSRSMDPSAHGPGRGVGSNGSPAAMPLRLPGRHCEVPRQKSIRSPPRGVPALIDWQTQLDPLLKGDEFGLRF